MAIIEVENFIFCAIIMAGVDTQTIGSLNAKRTALEKKRKDTWDQLNFKEKQLLLEKKRLNSAEEAQQKEISEFVNTLLGEIKNLGAIIADYEAQIAKTNQEIDDFKDSIKKLNEQVQSVKGVSVTSTGVSSAIDERSSDQTQIEPQKEPEPKQEVTQEVKTTPTSPEPEATSPEPEVTPTQPKIASVQIENLSEDQKARQLRDLLNSLSADLETQNPQNGRVLLSLSQLQAIEKINQLRLSSLRQEEISDFSLVEGDLSRSDKRYLWKQQRKALNKDTKEAKKDKKQLKKLAEARARNLNEKNQVNYEAGRVAFMEMLNSSFFERGGYTDEHLAFAPKNTNLIIELCKNADKLRNP
jgi:hypothetical protein